MNRGRCIRLQGRIPLKGPLLRPPTAPPDGYTILLATTGGMVSGPALGVKISYDPLKDFAPIGIAVYVPYSLVVNGGIPANNVREFIDYAKRLA